MRLRSFIFVGFCAALAMSSAAFAGTPAGTAEPQSVAKTDVVKVAARSDTAQLRLLKKKKKPTAEDLAAGRDPVMVRAFELAGGKVDPVAAGKFFPYFWKGED